MDEGVSGGPIPTCIFCNTVVASLNGFLLDCLHVICSQCVENKNTSLSCQVCAVDSAHSDVKKNLFYLNDRTTKCACSDRGVVTVKCVECDDFLCVQCEVAHRRVKLTKTHQLRKIFEHNVNICNQHSNSPYLWYCKTCDQKSCSTCQLSMHAGHEYISLEEHERSQQRIEEESMQTITKMTRNFVNTVVSGQKQQLSQICDIIKQSLEQAIKGQLEKIDEDENTSHLRQLEEQILWFASLPHYPDLSLRPLTKAHEILTKRLVEKKHSSDIIHHINFIKSLIVSKFQVLTAEISAEPDANGETSTKCQMTLENDQQPATSSADVQLEDMQINENQDINKTAVPLAETNKYCGINGYP